MPQISYENDSTLRAIAQCIPQLVWTTEPNGLCDFLNDRWFEYTGAPVATALGWGWKNSIHPDDLNNLFPAWLGALETGLNYEAELRFYHAASETYRWNLLRALPMRNSQGEIVKWFGTCTDIHDLKTAQAEAKTKARQLELITKNIPAVVWLADLGGTPDFVSNHWTRYTGTEWAEAKLRLHEFVHPDDLVKCSEIWRHSLAAGTCAEAELRLKRASDGKFAWNIIRIEPAKDSDSESVTGWIGTIIDISAQKDAESILQLVIDNIPGVIWWKDKESRYLGSSKTNAVRAGYQETSEIIGMSDRDLPWKDQAEFFIECDRRVMETNTPEYHIIEKMELADGKTAWLDTSKMPMHDADGNVIGTIGNYVDITQLVKLTEQREDFMASLAHDLKVPIVGAIRALDVLSTGMLGSLSADQSDFIKKLQNSHHHLLLLIQNLLQVLRYESSPDEMVLSELDLIAIALTCINELEPMATAKKIKLDKDFAEELLAIADGIAVDRLLMNLIGNAIKFTPEGGKIKISLKVDGVNIKIEISDTGNGISKDDQKMLFQRFWKGGALTKYAAETGLGLYLCRQISEGHGGQIRVESEEGQGSTFIVTFPRNRSDRQIERRPDQ